MGGWHAFPGGGVGRRDAELRLAGLPFGADEGPADAAIPEAVLGEMELEPALAPGIAACALRELFEETGILPAPELAGAAEPDLRRLAEARRRLLAGEGSFAEIVDAGGLTPDASALLYAGRWLTPPLGPLRFDNRFFLLEWPASKRPQPEVLPGEVESGEWVRPGEGFERWRRNEIITAPPILHLLQVLHEEGPERGLERLRAPHEANLGPFRKVEFRPGVLLFPLATATLPPAAHTNAYLLGRGETVLVDPGSSRSEEIDRLAAALDAARERLGRRVVEIWLTHHHRDHIGGVESLRQRLGVPVRAHRLTAERLGAAGIAVDGHLRDGERVELAGDPLFPLRALHTPGHAAGHLCFLDETGGSLIAGDMVAGFGTIVIDPPEGDMEAYLSSLERLRSLAPATLFPAHGPTIADPIAKLQEYLRHRSWREERILGAWEGGLRTPAEMLASVYDDAPAEALPLAERQILAHLEHLRRRGRI